MNLIATFEIPQYLREIEVSAKQRPKYYTWDGTTIKAKGKKLLQKYYNKKYDKDIIKNNGNILPHMLNYPYFIVGFKNKKAVSIFAYKENNTWKHSFTERELAVYIKEREISMPTEYYLFNVETKQRVIANETQAGKPKRIIIKGQDMYSGILNEFTRAKIVNELKEDYFNKLDWFPIITKSDYPVKIEMELVDTIKDFYDTTKEGDGRRWDVGNRCYPYLKTFVDFLVIQQVLPDDDRLHVIGEGYFFTPCERFEDRKLIFRIYSK